MNRFLCALATFILTGFILSPAYAVEAVPGDFCPTNNTVTHTGGPENAGNSYWMVCQAGTWRQIFSADANGMVSTNTPTSPNHVATKAYVDANASSCACDATPSAVGFTSLTEREFGTGVPVNSNIILVNDTDCASQVTTSGTGSPEYRICNDGACSNVAVTWTNAANNVNLGQYIQMRVTPGTTRNQTTTGTITFAGYYAASFSVTTRNYYRIFQTLQGYDGGSIGGLAGADAKCTTDKTAAGLPGTYKAFLSSSTVDAKNRVTQATVPYRNAWPAVNFIDLATNFADLIDGWGPGAVTTTTGTVQYSYTAWTNTNANGTRLSSNNANTCYDYTSNAGDSSVGYSQSGQYTWLYASGYSCAGYNTLYCLEQ